MSFCPACGALAAPASRFCTACGRPLSAAPTPRPAETSARDSSETIAATVAPAPRAARTPSSPSVSTGSLRSDTISAEFPPGTVLDARYRVVGILGRGGMGEVYRADDLTLGQAVALKFLAGAFEASQNRRDRFTSEVRTAREVAHPNVCRVYDIGDFDGRVYYAMEFIDGEDLSSLLRRIGRLPQEKGLEIARQLCAGLAAIHEKGVLHRDLKPANVMLDGRGRVRITDFGLSGAVDAIAPGDVRAGTPAYMAPEQRDGKEVTVRSDVYALGLVLYEIFTGKRAFEANTAAELARLQKDGTPASPSSVVPDLDPTLERVIERCLSLDPSKRPSSAISVAAALPGGDPVAAALAAGETPSPEMVAASGETGGIHPAFGVLCLLATAGAFFLHAGPMSQRGLAAYSPFEKPTPVLVERAREVLARVGVNEPARDSAKGFNVDWGLVESVGKADSSETRWELLRTARPKSLEFYYRQSPRELVATASDGIVTDVDPAMDEPGMALVSLDLSGRLTGLRVVPPDTARADSSSAPVAWNSLFEAAQLDMSRFAPTEPVWVPPVFAETRRAWIGRPDDATPWDIRVEAASFGGEPVWFRLIGPWRKPEEGAKPRPEAGENVGQVVILTLFLGMLTLAAFLAHRNLARGRGDRRGTVRLMGFVFFTGMLSWIATCNHTSDPNRIVQVLFPGLGMSVFIALLLGAFYLAIEPYARRVWPERMISWTRLLHGRWRDPLVGRDLVVGGAGFALLTVGGYFEPWILSKAGIPPGRPGIFYMSMFLGPGFVLDATVNQIVNGILNPLFFFMVLFFLRLVTRRTWIAIVIFLALFSCIGFAAGSFQPIVALFALFFGATIVTLLLRFGLLALIAAWTYRQMASSTALTLDPSAWYSGTSLFVIGLAVGVAALALANALRGRSFLREESVS